ncbi:MAG: PA14 domain-containing protein [Anaerolineae bacterium]|nr:PA14 domain-containing protein [Anaerolineae bacterium]
MGKKALIFLGVIVVLALSSTATAQGPVVPQHSDANWQATYWNNMNLSGGSVLQREEPNLDYNWGAGTPGSGVNADGFSARWTRYLDLAAGTYRFTTVSDDGLRLWVDGTLLIDEWTDHSAKTVSADKALAAGHHLVIVEFYENTGDAVAKLSWAPAITINNWRGAYFNNRTLSNTPALVRDDTRINFDWGSGSPAPGIINADNFSVRWTRTLNLSAGSYRFTATVDDGVRLWIGSHLLIDAWKDQAARTYSDTIYVPAGGVAVKMEYYERTGAAVAKLSWTAAGNAPAPAPGTVIVDDGDAGFVKGGRAASWRRELEGYNGDLLWTQNNDYARPNYNWARWYPNLKAGRYQVYVYIPHRFTTTAKARYWISHANGYTLRIVNQSAYSNQWVSLGTYRFRGTKEDYVSLADPTYEPYLTRLIAWDAVKWVPR